MMKKMRQPWNSKSSRSSTSSSSPGNGHSKSQSKKANSSSSPEGASPTSIVEFPHNNGKQPHNWDDHRGQGRATTMGKKPSSPRSKLFLRKSSSNSKSSMNNTTTANSGTGLVSTNTEDSVTQNHGTSHSTDCIDANSSFASAGGGSTSGNGKAHKTVRIHKIHVTKKADSPGASGDTAARALKPHVEGRSSYFKKQSSMPSPESHSDRHGHVNQNVSPELRQPPRVKSRSVSEPSPQSQTQTGTQQSHFFPGEDLGRELVRIVTEMLCFADPIRQTQSDCRRRTAKIETTNQESLSSPSSYRRKNGSEFASHVHGRMSDAKLSHKNPTRNLEGFLDDSALWGVCVPGTVARPGGVSQDTSYLVLGVGGSSPGSRNIPHHRACEFNGQARILRDLRHYTTFEGAPRVIATVKSEGDDYRGEEFRPRGPEGRNGLPPSLLADTLGLENLRCPCLPVFDGTTSSSSAGGVTDRHHPSSMAVYSHHSMSQGGTDVIDDHCYDSDPSEMRFVHRRPRRTIVEDDPPSRNMELLSSSSSSSMSSSPKSRLATHYDPYSRLQHDLHDEAQLEACLEEIKHTKMALIWHPSQRRGEDGERPHRIMSSRAWIEMGSLLPHTIIHPRFMWKPRYEPHLHRHRIHTALPYSIDLLDIIGIVPASNHTVSREEHPHVRVKNSFQVLTVRNQYYLFEAQTAIQRDRIVLGLKLVVARLASKVLVSGRVAEDEFFTPDAGFSEAWWDQFEEEEEYDGDAIDEGYSGDHGDDV